MVPLTKCIIRNEYLTSVVDGPRWDDSTVLARMELRVRQEMI